MNQHAKIFISYAHADEDAVKELHKHLAVLAQNNEIQTWHDRQILAGADWAKEIDTELEASDIFLAIISPDFLASEYCYKKEMEKALLLHDKNQIRVIPIIVEQCDWRNSPLGSLQAIPQDGKAISDWINPNTAWLSVIGEIRKILPLSERALSEVAVERSAITIVPEKKYRVRREFDPIDRSDFRERAYHSIHDYFQQAIEELNSVDGVKARFRKINEVAFTCSIFNKMKTNGEAHLTVRIGGSHSSMGDISYSFSENDVGNSANGWYSIEADEYEMFLSPFEFSGFDTTASKKLTAKSASQLLWQVFIEQAGISYA